MENMIFSVFISALKLFFRILWKIILFTGLFWLVGSMFVYIFIENVTPLDGKSTLSFVVGISILGVGAIGTVYTFLQNLFRFFGVRFFGLDPSFKLYQAIPLFRERDGGKVKAAGELMQQLGSREPKGVVFGRRGAQWLCKPEIQDGHILVMGGVGSGKSSFRCI